MPRIQNPSSPEFRREAVARIRSTGRSIREVAGELGISYASLRLWRKQEQSDLDEREDRLTNHERVEVRELIQDMHDERDLQDERDVEAYRQEERLSG